MRIEKKLTVFNPRSLAALSPQNKDYRTAHMCSSENKGKKALFGLEKSDHSAGTPISENSICGTKRYISLLAVLLEQNASF